MAVVVGSCVGWFFVGPDLRIYEKLVFYAQNMGLSVLVFFVVMVVGLSS